MRILTGTLFVLGIGWALVAWILVLMPLGALGSQYHSGGLEIVWSIVLSLLSILGYQIWIGWGIHCLTGNYVFGGPRVFWCISLMHHVLWALLIPPAIAGTTSVEETLQSFWSRPDELWTTGEGLPYRTWILLNIAVASICLVRGIQASRRNSELNRVPGSS